MGNARYGSSTDLSINCHGRNTSICNRGFAGLPGFKPARRGEKQTRKTQHTRRTLERASDVHAQAVYANGRPHPFSVTSPR
jgi:hypothetical protein